MSKTIKIVAFVFVIFFLSSCKENSYKTYRIGFDPNWYPLNFENQQPNVYGFTEELLLEIARTMNVKFIKVHENSISLKYGLEEAEVDAIVSSMPPLNFNRDKYLFSQNFLNFGPSLVVLKGSSTIPPNGKIGTFRDSDAELIVQKYPDIIIQKYDNLPDALEAVLAKQIDGAVVNRIVALPLVKEHKQLKMLPPLTKDGLKLVTLKKEKRFMEIFNKGLKKLEKANKLKALKKKWNLWVD